MIRSLLISFLIFVSPVFGSVTVSQLEVKQLVYPVHKPARPSPPAIANEISKGAAVAAGMVLAFNSGYTNGCCLGGGLLGGKDKFAVVAVTGAWTTSSAGFASGDMTSFYTSIRAILSYFSGSAIAGLMIPRPKPFVLDSATGPAFLIGSALLYAASRFAESSPTTKACFFLALMANGLQNSITSVHTANLCRSSHFTGITSDMGTFAGQCLRGNTENFFKLQTFALLGLSFWIGGFTGYFVSQILTSASLYMSAALYAIIGLSLLMQK
jgi:uncharacterized membrane protein YoaK (UPF0700 family)